MEEHHIQIVDWQDNSCTAFYLDRLGVTETI